MKTLDIEVTHLLDHSNIPFLGFQFELKKGISVDEGLSDVTHFRLEKFKTGDAHIMVSGIDQWTVHENVTHLFNVQDIFSECRKQLAERGIVNASEEYLEYHEEVY